MPDRASSTLKPEKKPLVARRFPVFTALAADAMSHGHADIRHTSKCPHWNPGLMLKTGRSHVEIFIAIKQMI